MKTYHSRRDVWCSLQKKLLLCPKHFSKRLSLTNWIALPIYIEENVTQKYFLLSCDKTHSCLKKGRIVWLKVGYLPILSSKLSFGLLRSALTVRLELNR